MEPRAPRVTRESFESSVIGAVPCFLASTIGSTACLSTFPWVESAEELQSPPCIGAPS